MQIQNKSLLAVLALASAIASRPAAALHENPEQDKPFAPLSYLSFGGFYEDPDTARGVDSGLGSNYGYGRSFAGSRAWELRLFGATLETGEAGRTDFYQYGVGVDVFQHFLDISSGHPYLVGGLGAVLNDVDPDDADGVSGYAGLGAGWRFAPITGWGVRPRVDLRAVYDTFDAGDGAGQLDLLLGVTLEIPAEREKIVVQEKTVEVEKVVEVVKEVAVAPVATDRDGDGIADDRDQCPDTVGGAKVEADGCVRKAQVVALPNIEFAYAKADLTEAGRETLGQVVRFMNDQPEITLDVWGHTDAPPAGTARRQGAELYNLRLSQKRAAAVMKYLVEQGIAESRLKSAGFGESRPLADNETEEGRERNRRVELNIRARSGGQP